MSPTQKKLLTQESSVIHFLEPVKVSFMNQPMAKVGDFLKALKSKLLGFSPNDWDKEHYIPYQQWFTDGYEAEILDVAGSGWKKGKVKIKISLEFIPNATERGNAESPLDDIRQSISEP
ncbi:KGK domain-containing protein [Picosynechococcus sp. PCC 73109]|uniref:KGK domain-containing protein n=1 Tax=Picosynechococcus sp. PCC 73109 TaxID=374982 RepID=UPI0007457E04|nr:KGK domain-containing protein [Picosynechococcus sp. PCC 73109]AMA07890.1 hypothetical protein AWQ23_00355 [Picosynechococcus sp. PCC 73109]